MRALIWLPLAALAIAGCKVSKDDQNDTITAEFNQDIAENGLEDAANFAENVGEDIANDVEGAAEKAENVDVQVDTNTAN